MAEAKALDPKTHSHAVVGLGYVGLPLALEFCEAGFRVIGFDISKSKIEGLRNGVPGVDDITPERLKKAISEGRLEFTDNASLLAEADSVSICVPTPLSKSKQPDLSYVQAAADALLEVVKPGALLVLESTTYPGTTRELLADPAREKGFTPGEDLNIAFSPERVDPGNKVWNTKNTPKVLGGLTPECTRRAKALYEHSVDTVIEVGSCEEAEMVKLLENTFRMVNIGLINEITLMCDRMGINIWNVIDAAATKPFGFMPFYPGPGIGGHCIPLDPHYLSFKAKNFNFFNRFIEAATDINGNMPRFVLEKAQRILNQFEKPLKNSRIHVLGVAYKPDISDARESPAKEVIQLLMDQDAKVSYEDPLIPEYAVAGKTFASSPMGAEDLQGLDLIVLVTNHKTLDLDTIAGSGVPVLDTRNAFKGVAGGSIFSL